MSDKNEEFQQRWGFRRNDSDVDSSSNDQSSEPKRKKHKMATRLFPDEDDQKTVHSPQSHPTGEEDHSSDEEQNKETNTTVKKKKERKARKASNVHEPVNGLSIDLSGHMESLVEGVKVARTDLLKWMNNELQTSSKKSQRRGTKSAQNAVVKRSKTPRSNPNKTRKKSNASAQNPEDGSTNKLAKDSKTSRETSEVVVPTNEPTTENVVNPAEKIPKHKGGKRLAVSSSKKQKTAASDQQTADKAPAETAPPATAASASASNYLTLPTVLPRQETENSGKTNSTINLGSQLNFTPRANGMRNVSEYEQNAAAQTGGNIWAAAGNAAAGTLNGSAGVFPFGLHSQGGLNGGIHGMPNFPSQFGLQQYLSQESILSGLRMNGGGHHPVLPTANHGFNESYGAAFNQQLRFKAAQNGGLMPLHSPDNIRAGNLQPR